MQSYKNDRLLVGFNDIQTFVGLYIADTRIFFMQLYSYKNMLIFLSLIAQSAGAVKLADCISAEE